MPELNCDVPGGHFYAYVRREHLHNLESHHGELEECAVFGINSVPSRGLTFQVLLKSGAQFARIPLHALVWKPDAPVVQLHERQLWDCFGVHVTAIAYEFLKERECRCYLKKGQFVWGQYVFTLDWHSNGWSDEPSQHKNAHVIKLDDGTFCALPNNRIFWRDASFTQWPTGKPTYRTNHQKYHAETDTGHIDAHVMGGEAPSDDAPTLERDGAPAH
jgi:hypothetical protein